MTLHSTNHTAGGGYGVGSEYPSYDSFALLGPQASKAKLMEWFLWCVKVRLTGLSIQ